MVYLSDLSHTQRSLIGNNRLRMSLLLNMPAGMRVIASGAAGFDLFALHAQVRTSEKTPILTCLLEGPTGTGKTALAATIGIVSQFPYVKLISAENMVGYSEQAKAAQIAKVFDDAYRVSHHTFQSLPLVTQHLMVLSSLWLQQHLASVLQFCGLNNKYLVKLEYLVRSADKADGMLCCCSLSCPLSFWMTLSDYLSTSPLVPASAMQSYRLYWCC